MTSVILIPWGQTDWQAAGRYATTTPVSINTTGAEQMAPWAEMIKPHRPLAVYSANQGPGLETAQRLAKLLAMKHRKVEDLEEVDLGLWEGLTPDQLKKRHAKVYKQWRDDPSSVCPPEGEDLAEAGRRLKERVHRLATKHVGECFAVTLGPIAMAAIRCRFEDQQYSQVWKIPTDKPVRYIIDPEEKKAVLTSTESREQQ